MSKRRDDGQKRKGPFLCFDIALVISVAMESCRTIPPPHTLHRFNWTTQLSILPLPASDWLKEGKRGGGKRGGGGGGGGWDATQAGFTQIYCVSILSIL